MTALADWSPANWRNLIAANVAEEISGVPTLTEIAGRLSAMPSATLQAVVQSDPAGYARIGSDASDAAAFLRDLAAVFEATAASLKSAGGT